MATPTSEQRRGVGKAPPLTPEEEVARQRLKRLIDTDTGEELVKATSELTDKYFVYPVIAKMCLTGVG